MTTTVSARKPAAAKRDFVTLSDWDRPGLEAVLTEAARVKRDFRERGAADRLRGRTLAMIFHKPSLRTRVSFEVGMTQLGGAAIYITEKEIGIDSREAVEDVARVLSGYVDAIMIRTFKHDLVRGLARHASVPVINGLDDLVHPCQILADLMTLRELGLGFDGLPVAWLGDGNNVAHSWIDAAQIFGLDLRLAVPKGYEPDAEILARARKAGAKLLVTHDPRAAVAGARMLYTDVWASMGQESEAAARREVFRPFQLNAALLKAAHPQAVVMHCLPAHRGDEITADVFEGPQSVVFHAAENRMHAQKGLLASLISSSA
jgi:ornithine carbamoyltransferase